MIRDIQDRIGITVINFFFPPLAVALLAGLDWDTTINCVLFLLLVLPSHVHGFYISSVYFHRQKKVKKGRWPGGPKPLIRSQNILNGGASDAEVERLWRKEHGMEETSTIGRSRSRNSHGKPKRLVRHGSKARRHHLPAPEIKGSQRSGKRDRSRVPERTSRSGVSPARSGSVDRDGYGPTRAALRH